MVEFSFNANDHEPQTSFDPIPAGWYTAAVEFSEMRQTRAGDGSYLSVRFAVLDGGHKGRRLFTMFNIENPNPKAVEIAQGQLSAMCRAIGVLQLSDSTQLHDKPMAIKVTVVPSTGQYEAKNDVKGYKPLEGGLRQQPQQQDDNAVPGWAQRPSDDGIPF